MVDNSNDSSSFVLPSSPADLKKIRQALDEGVNCEIRMASERQAKKDIVDRLADEYELPKKISARMIKTMYKHNFSEVQSEMDDFQIAYEKITRA